MTVITLEGVPIKYTINRCVGIISKAIKVEFEGLNFTPSTRKGCKAFHINITDDTKVDECVRTLNGMVRQNVVFSAFVNKTQPYMNPNIKKFKKGKNRNRHLKMPQTLTMSKDRIFLLTRNNLMYELLDKYTALIDLNKTTGNRLLHEIVKVVEQRLRPLLEQSENCFLLSSNYRFKHPHTTDFDTIKTCLSMTGSKIVLTKEMLKPTPKTIELKLGDTMPLGKVQGAISRYSSAIQLELVKYVNSLQTDMQVGEGQIDAAAHSKVREQFKKMAPSLPFIVCESLTKHVIPTSNVTILRIYGEPSLPKPPTMQEFVSKYRGTMTRSPHLYNCVHVQVPNAEVPALLASDNTCVEGRNLVIRVFTKETYKTVLDDVNAASRGKSIIHNMPLDDEDAWENWDEEEMK